METAGRSLPHRPAPACASRPAVSTTVWKPAWPRHPTRPHQWLPGRRMPSRRGPQSELATRVHARSVRGRRCRDPGAPVPNPVPTWHATHHRQCLPQRNCSRRPQPCRRSGYGRLPSRSGSCRRGWNPTTQLAAESGSDQLVPFESACLGLSPVWSIDRWPDCLPQKPEAAIGQTSGPKASGTGAEISVAPGELILVHPFQQRLCILATGRQTIPDLRHGDTAEFVQQP